MVDRLIGPRIKVARAKFHLDRLAGDVAQYLASGALRVSAEHDLDSNRVFYRFRIDRAPPADMAAAVGDVIHNLRSSLDLLAWQLVESNGGNPGQNTTFVISDNDVAFAARLPAVLPGITQQAKQRIQALRPYRGGDDRFWELNKLDNFDKHRLLLVVGSAYRSVSLLTGHEVQQLMNDQGVAGDFPPIRLPPLRPADRQFPLADGSDLYIAPGDRDDEPQFAIEICFAQTGIVDDKPIVETLQSYVDAVDRAIESFHPLN